MEEVVVTEGTPLTVVHRDTSNASTLAREVSQVQREMIVYICVCIYIYYFVCIFI
jgi:hypothetical protein